MWYSPEDIAKLLSEDGELTYDDIGTPQDTGSLDPSDDGEYEGEHYQSYDTIEGLVHAITHGPLKLRAMEAPNFRAWLSEMIVDLLERSVVDYGTLEDGLQALCFTPDDDDLYDGARLEVRNNHIIAFNGHDAEQSILSPTTQRELIRDFVKAGIYVAAGMIKSVADL